MVIGAGEGDEKGRMGEWKVGLLAARALVFV
jgi:hypothetical protein